MTRNGKRYADDTLVLSLACGSTAEAAAQKAGVSIATVYRRLGDAAFQAKLATARGEMIGRATAMLTAAAMEAVKTLLDLQGKTVAASARLGAAKAVLEIGNRLRLEGELVGRMESIERALGLRT
jgi:transposase